MTTTSHAEAFALHRNPAPLPVAERAAILADPGFGRTFTDHMARVRWDADRGWHDPELVPYGPLTIDPATNVIHYGQSIFEGLKAYRHADGTVKTFRPWANAARFAKSARRLAMPELPEELFLGSLQALVGVDSAWVPADAERSLYLRPFMFATEVGLGVRPANAYDYLLIASPAGAYFAGGVHPVSVWLCDDYVRAAPGGTGEAKCAGNYAASLIAQAEAIEQGCDQVVWLDAAEHRWVEEMGGMNLFFVYGSGRDARVVTPALTGALLEGVTRSSLLTLAADLGYGVEEARVSVEEWRAGNASGQLTEVFACGTAAVITPVGHVKSRDAQWSISGGTAGPITLQLREALLDIQTGAAADPHGWMYPLG
ncbi:MAG: branched-chain amino acid aminotransferase [Actinomycetota bacterium]|nr:MAG: branched-chain amino acid aminotransferase [Actinomycetota bacterium]